MKPDRSFPATNWNAIRAAARDETASRALALEELLSQYLPILKDYLQTRFHLPEQEIEDLLQNFVVHKILNRDLIARADPARGRFRILLVNAATRFVVSEIRRAKAQKRAPNHAALPLEFISEKELAGLAEHAHSALDLAFARRVFAEAVRCMKVECVDSKRPDIWGVFDGRYLQPFQKGVEHTSNETLMRALGLASPAQVSNILTTAKRMFARNFRSVVTEYTREPKEAESEIRALKTLLAQSE